MYVPKSAGWILLILLVAAPAWAGNDEVVGTWKLQLEVRGQAVEVELVIEESEEGLIGSWNGPRQSGELSNVTWDGSKLTFERELERQGQRFTIRHEATVTGDSMEGRILTPRGERPFSGERSG